MHELILLRHAQAEAANPAIDDYARALTDAGRAQALAAAQRLRAEGDAPGLLLYSPARRTQDTALIVSGELGMAGTAVRSVPTLYLADTSTLRAIIGSHGATVRRLLVIGHNPDLSELGAQLSAAHEGGHLATGEYWRLALDAATWRSLAGA